jgi:hypothetical protein
MTIARDLSKILDANGDLNIDAYTLFVDSSTNRVGIGTSSPNRALSISSGTGGSETIALEAISGATDANTATTFRLTNSTGFGSAAGAVELKSLRDGSGTGASFVISGSTASSTVVERMRINSSGNVGIGTSSPNQKLTVAGNIEIYRDDADGYIWFHDFGTRSWALGHDVTNGAFVINSNSDLTANNRFAIATTGNVGIGTSSPDNLLHIEGDQPTYKLTSTNPLSTGGGTETIADIDFEGQHNNIYRTTARIRARQDGTWSTVTTNYAPTALDFFTQDNETSDGMTSPRMTINEIGNVGIGTSSPTNFGSNFKMLAVEGSDFGVIQSVSNSGSVTTEMMASASVGFIGTRTNHPFVIRTNDTERMRIDSSGNLLVGGTTVYGSCKTTIDSGSGNSLACRLTNTGASYALWYYNSTITGSIGTNGTTTSYNTSSDYRLKENVVDITGATDRLKQLSPKRFNFIADADTTVDGFLAHEVSDIVPEAISGTKDEVDADGNPKYQGIDQSKLVPLLVASLKEALTEIDNLKARVDTLEGN